MIGLGVMLDALRDKKSSDLNNWYGKQIKSVDSTNEHFDLLFEDGSALRIRDAGQSCCEDRYMTCDDDVSKIVGSKLTKIELRDGPREDIDWSEHETMFVEIATDECFVTLTTHNKHNGYYGGFAINIQPLIGVEE